MKTALSNLRSIICQVVAVHEVKKKENLQISLSKWSNQSDCLKHQDQWVCIY